MKKPLKKKDKEPLHAWVERISIAYGLTDEQTEMVHEVAKVAYVVGSDAMWETLKRDI